MNKGDQGVFSIGTMPMRKEFPMPSVTGTIKRDRTNIRERLQQRTIDYFQALRRKCDAILYNVPPQLPPPATAKQQAAWWEREAPKCEQCHSPMIRNLFTRPNFPYAAGEYFCEECYWESINQSIAANRASSVKALFHDAGQLMAGVRTRNYRQALQQKIISSVTPQLPDPHITGELPAKDIVLNNTPRKQLFDDAELVQIGMSLDEIFPEGPIDPDATEFRRVVRKPAKETKYIPGITAEMLLEAIINGATETHKQSTGENERLDDKQKSGAWLL